jgi:hypothetical protein
MISTLRLRCRDDARKPPRCHLWLCAAVSLVVLSAPAWADEKPRGPVVVAVASAPASFSVAALFGDHEAVGQTELAAQRGGAAFTVPIAQTAPQTATPHIVLWDELKGATPVTPAGQGTNRINIQSR